MKQIQEEEKETEEWVGRVVEGEEGGGKTRQETLRTQDKEVYGDGKKQRQMDREEEGER